MGNYTEEIKREDWIPFLDEFTREHEGWEVTLEILGDETGAQVAAHDIPLQGISADVSRTGEHDIAISVGGENDAGLTRRIANAAHLRVERTGLGNDAAVEIESADGTRTLLKLHRIPEAA